jgi:hypothetical protein
VVLPISASWVAEITVMSHCAHPSTMIFNTIFVLYQFYLKTDRPKLFFPTLYFALPRPAISMSLCTVTNIWLAT